VVPDQNTLAEHSELGKKTYYDFTYQPDKLFAIRRENKRLEIGIVATSLPFVGYDLWNHAEVSWLNKKGKPIVALAEIIFDAASPYLIESKSMKLYFNSLNNTSFASFAVVEKTIEQDLTSRVGSPVKVNIYPLSAREEKCIASFEGICLDQLDLTCSHYTVMPSLLSVESELVSETVYSNLLCSKCLVTGQPDWGTIQIEYEGLKINHDCLLQYIISFRNHFEFGEHCIERIFMDLRRECRPQNLMVLGQYTRRGGIDINCIRATSQSMLAKRAIRRLYRQ
jgi:7-cyano-7-deazaguanine reductase